MKPQERGIMIVYGILKYNAIILQFYSWNGELVNILKYAKNMQRWLNVLNFTHVVDNVTFLWSSNEINFIVQSQFIVTLRDHDKKKLFVFFKLFIF